MPVSPRDAGERPLVVVAEDDPDVQSLVATALEAEGCDVLVAGDGRQALDLTAANDVDLLVLDLVMPSVGGLDVLRELRRRGGRPPVLVLTARADDDVAAACRGLGADAYLTKPFRLRDVRDRARELLGRTR